MFVAVASFPCAPNTLILLCPQFAAWVDAVVFVFSLEDEISFQTVYNYFLRLSSYRNTAEVPMVLVGTQGVCPTFDMYIQMFFIASPIIKLYSKYLMLLCFPSIKDRSAVLNLYLHVNKSQEKTKTDNEFIVLVVVVWVPASLCVKQTSVAVHVLLKHTSKPHYCIIMGTRASLIFSFFFLFVEFADSVHNTGYCHFFQEIKCLIHIFVCLFVFIAPFC